MMEVTAANIEKKVLTDTSDIAFFLNHGTNTFIIK